MPLDGFLEVLHVLLHDEHRGLVVADEQVFGAGGRLELVDRGLRGRQLFSEPLELARVVRGELVSAVDDLVDVRVAVGDQVLVPLDVLEVLRERVVFLLEVRLERLGLLLQQLVLGVELAVLLPVLVDLLLHLSDERGHLLVC